MNDETKAALRHFAGLANPSGLHPLDWERLADFTIHCHKSGDWPTGDEVTAELPGFDPEVSNQVATFVGAAYILLQRYDEAR